MPLRAKTKQRGIAKHNQSRNNQVFFFDQTMIDDRLIIDPHALHIVTKGTRSGWEASSRLVSAHERNTKDGVKRRCIRWG
jgi:hypothetical protein